MKKKKKIHFYMLPCGIPMKNAMLKKKKKEEVAVYNVQIRRKVREDHQSIAVVKSCVVG